MTPINYKVGIQMDREHHIDMKDGSSHKLITIIKHSESDNNYRFRVRKCSNKCQKYIVVARCTLTSIEDVIRKKFILQLEKYLGEATLYQNRCVTYSGSRGPSNWVSKEETYREKAFKNTIGRPQSEERWSLLRQKRLQASIHCCEMMKISVPTTYGKVKHENIRIESPDFSLLENLSFDELIEKSIRSKNDSLVVELYLEYVSVNKKDFKNYFKKSFKAHLPYLATTKNRIFILCCMISISKEACNLYSQFVQQNLMRLIQNYNCLKPIQTLVSLSTSFCDFFLYEFVRNYEILSTSKYACIIVNNIVEVSTCNESGINRVIKRIESDLLSFHRGNKKELLRICSSLLNRCGLDIVSGIVRFVQHNIWWLVDDKIGNYSVQELFEVKFVKYWKSSFDHLNRYHVSVLDGKYLPKILFVKLIRYDVLQYMEIDYLYRQEEQYHRAYFTDLLIISLNFIFNDAELLRKALNEERSNKLLLLSIYHLYVKGTMDLGSMSWIESLKKIKQIESNGRRFKGTYGQQFDESRVKKSDRIDCETEFIEEIMELVMSLDYRNTI